LGLWSVHWRLESGARIDAIDALWQKLYEMKYM
jgi:hypothetical protein